MQSIPLYNGIVLLLTQCGVTSLRMFLPTFLYLLLLRCHGTLAEWGACPQMLADLAAATPAWMSHDATLLVFGVLALLEYLALHNDDLREFMTGTLDKYAKAVFTFLVTYSFISPEQAAQVKDLAPLVSGVPADAGAALLCGGATLCLAGVREKILETLRAFDPDNCLGLQGLAARAEEVLCLAAVFLLVLLPLLALFLVAAGYLLAALLRLHLARRERLNSHSCPACAAVGKDARVSNAAEICPECRAPQTPVRQAGWFGIATAEEMPEDGRADHRLRLLRARRCPLCATPAIIDGVCPRCGGKIWEQGWSREEYAAVPARAAVKILIAGVFLTAMPVAGLLLTLVLFNLYALRPLKIYLTWGQKAKGRFLFKFARMVMLLAALVLAAVPFAGLLVLVPYWLAYSRARRDFLTPRP